MKNIQWLVFSLVCLSLLSACGFFADDGACEYRNDYSHSNSTFGCTNEKSDFFTPAKDNCTLGDARSFHSNTSCSSIGYSQKNPYSSSLYHYNDDLNQSPYGATSLKPTNNGSSGGSGTGGSQVNCNTVWTGSPTDLQVSTQCQAACSYQNIGHNDGKNAACSIVAGWGATSKCSVCP